MREDKYQAVVITPDAWVELYEIIRPFVVGLSEWGQKNDQPLSVALGIVFGVASVMATIGNACDCDACEYTADTVAGELFDRMMSAMDRVKH